MRGEIVLKNKKLAIIILVVTAVIIVTIFSYKNLIFQEGNPMNIIAGIIQLNDVVTYVNINDNPVAYLTKNNNSGGLFSYIEEENRVKFKEQMGSVYIFEGDDKNVILVSRQYMRFY